MSATAASLLTDLDVNVQTDVPLGPRTWFKIGGRADYLVSPNTVEALATLTSRCRESDTPLRVLGAGANLLVDDEGVDGVVVELTAPVFRADSWIHRHRPNRGGEQGDGLRVMAGTRLEVLARGASRHGMRGLERLAGIPATLGGAIRMNAGGKWGEIGDLITLVGCIDLNGRQVVYQGREIEWAYRRCSIIDPVILWAELALTPDDPEQVYADYTEIMREKTASQPMGDNSAGCVFKNPPHPETTGFRISAGRIIDRAGLRGLRIGGAEVSSRHANFIVAEKGCPTADVLALISRVEARVFEETGFRLERELVVWRRRETDQTEVA